MFRRNSLPVWIGIILLSGVFLMGQGTLQACDEVVDFEDRNLEEMIRQHIDKPGGPICSSDLAGLRTLDASASSIFALTGLEDCTASTVLYLEGNQISDISPLVGLTDLRWLKLNDNQISDIYPLVQNPGIDAGDFVHLYPNPLSSTSCTTYIPELESRGVIVWHDCP